MNNKNIKQIVAIGIGIPLFIISTYISIPVGFNTNIQSRLVILTIFAVLFGPKVGFLVGFIGHALSDALLYGNIWWSWVIPSGILGLGLGYINILLHLSTSKITGKKILIFNLLQFLINVLCWLVIAPTLDVYIYSEPLARTLLQGVLSTISNTFVVGVMGVILLKKYFKNNKE